MNLVSHGSSAASSAKCSSATGSRSMAISVPLGPIRPATGWAWPPAPNVQSIAVSPACGSVSSMSSPARTGTCDAVISRSMPEALDDLVDLTGQRGVVVRPRGAVPHLQVVPHSGHHDLLAKLRVRVERLRHRDAPGAVELGLVRVGEEVLAQAARVLREGVLARQRGLELAVEVLGLPDLDAAGGARRQDDA